jgi:hypothetical protein
LIKSSKTKYSNKKFVKNSLETKFENKNFHEKSSGKIIEKNFNGGPPAGELFGLPAGASSSTTGRAPRRRDSGTTRSNSTRPAR